MGCVRSGVAALIAASVLQAACAAKPALGVRPAEEIASRLLDPAVDAAMVIELARYAAKDRLCAQSSRGLPPKMHAQYGHYIRCMEERQSAPCEATAEDLRTVRTLLDRDPRLAAILSFEQLFARLQSDCAGHGNLPTTARAVRIWAPRHLENCEMPYQPVLITAAIMLRTLPPRDADSSIFWYAGCRGAAGYFFLEGHCLRLKRLEGRNQPEEASRIAQGIEAYFCPQIAKYFGA